MKALIATAIGACCAVIFLCLIVAGSAAYFTWDLHQTQIVLRASIAPLQDAASKGIADTFDNLNRPCAPGPCGLLPNGTKVETKVGDAIVTTQLQERTDRASRDRRNGHFQHSRPEARLHGGQPLRDRYGAHWHSHGGDGHDNHSRNYHRSLPACPGRVYADGKDLDTRINDPHVTALVAHLVGMSASGDLMLADVQWKTHQLLHPDRVKLGFWGGTWAGIQAVHKLEPPIF